MLTIEEIRSHRILGIALFDLLATFVASFLIHLYVYTHPIGTPQNRSVFTYTSSLVAFTIGILGLGIIIHYIFGVRTTVGRWVGLND